MNVAVIQNLPIHPEFPALLWVVVEQPPGEPFRVDYVPESRSFRRSVFRSLFYDRGFSGAYGWIGGLGYPPGDHRDVILVTRQPLEPGAVVLGHTCGIFFRVDGDNKVVALDHALLDTVTEPDRKWLDPTTAAELRACYPRMDQGEGWWGAYVARRYLRHWRTPREAAEAPRGEATWGPTING